jgi:DNA phosphorothioation system restriction enzyme
VNAAAGFRSLRLDSHYRSDANDVVAEFYVPLLSTAREYARAVGYFTSTSLALVARGLSQYVANGGGIRIIASPQLDADDIEDLHRGYALREVLTRTVERALSTDVEAELDGLGHLGRLVAEGRLDIKLAFVNARGAVGVYHEKIGFFVDGNGEAVAFTGSANETYGGLLANFESVEVFRQWEPGDGARVKRIREDFERLWQDATPGLAVQEFPEVARERLIAIGRERPGSQLPGTDTAISTRKDAALSADVLVPPHGIVMRGYQRDAITAWMRNGGRGMLKMATGTGKTKTALFAARAVARTQAEADQPLLLIVVAPYQHLIDQWIEEFEAFGVRALGIYESSERWQPHAHAQMQAAQLGRRRLVAMVATNKSFAGQRFQDLLSSARMPVMLVADEAHNFGARRMLRSLPAGATYRLALSATPERWFDDEGTAAIADYFGPVVFEMGLGQAIEMGALCSYEYLPRIVELNRREAALYSDITAKIGRMFAAGVDDEDERMGQLLRRRAAVLGHAAGKLPMLRLDLEKNRDSWYQLVYCAEGNRPGDDNPDEGPNQLDDVVQMVGREMGIAVARYVSETPRSERRRLLRRLASGDDLRVLAAMRCLDEGVDIPDARIAYILASSSNPKQFIQRRGRVLRPAPGKDRATIYDYIVVPPQGTDTDPGVERRLLTRELIRAAEFAGLAENYHDSLEMLRPIKQRYGLMDL